MGTRADFYVGSGLDAEWVGSIAWDGHPESIDKDILCANTIDQYRAAIHKFLANRDDATTPNQGWPWPWDDSTITDYAYCFVENQVRAWVFGCGPFDPVVGEDVQISDQKGLFPNMAERKNIALGLRSGLTIVRLEVR